MIAQNTVMRVVVTLDLDGESKAQNVYHVRHETATSQEDDDVLDALGNWVATQWHRDLDDWVGFENRTEEYHANIEPQNLEKRMTNDGGRRTNGGSRQTLSFYNYKSRAFLNSGLNLHRSYFR